MKNLRPNQIWYELRVFFSICLKENESLLRKNLSCAKRMRPASHKQAGPTRVHEIPAPLLHCTLNSTGKLKNCI